jgi:hypothetical protein
MTRECAYNKLADVVEIIGQNLGCRPAHMDGGGEAVFKHMLELNYPGGNL